MTTIREQVLLDGVELTSGDRNRTYGAPAPNLTLQMQLWELYKAAAGDKYPPAHDAAIQHVCAKLARIASGRIGHRDNYVDLATYAAIAYECSGAAVVEQFGEAHRTTVRMTQPEGYVSRELCACSVPLEDCNAPYCAWGKREPVDDAGKECEVCGYTLPMAPHGCAYDNCPYPRPLP